MCVRVFTSSKFLANIPVYTVGFALSSLKCYASKAVFIVLALGFLSQMTVRNFLDKANIHIPSSYPKIALNWKHGARCGLYKFYHKF